MPANHVNWVAVVVAALSCFVLGGLWYSPVAFGRWWMVANGFSDIDMRKGSQAKIFSVAAILALVMSANLAMFLAQPTTTVAWGATAGFFAGFGWVALGVAMIALFERRSWTYILINGGYMTVAFVVMGAILGAWR